MIDPGANETAAVADLNNDGRPDIIHPARIGSEAPTWTKHPLRAIDFNANYVDNFTDIAIDVDGDWVDVVQFGYFSSKIVWLKIPGSAAARGRSTKSMPAVPRNSRFLVDLNNDGKAQELLPEFDRANRSRWPGSNCRAASG